jgi:hypothetical protein
MYERLGFQRFEEDRVQPFNTEKNSMRKTRVSIFHRSWAPEPRLPHRTAPGPSLQLQCCPLLIEKAPASPGQHRDLLTNWAPEGIWGPTVQKSYLEKPRTYRSEEVTALPTLHLRRLRSAQRLLLVKAGSQGDHWPRKAWCQGHSEQFRDGC